MGKWTLGLVGLVLLVSSCGQSDSGVIVTRSDSAGVALVMNSGPDRGASWSLSLDYRLGGQPSGPESFYQLYPRYVSVSPTGTIGVLNQQAFQASVFGPDGRLLRTYGDEGDGPGEFSFPSAIAVRPDGEVLVYDFRKRALVRFTADGNVLDESRLTVPFNGVGMAGTRSGLLLLSDTRPRGDGEVTRRILHLSPTDTVQLGPTVAGSSKTIYYSSCGGVRMSLPPLFSADLVWASNGVRTAISPGPHYSVWMFDDTTLVNVVRRDIEPEAVTSEVAERELGDGEAWGVAGQECVVPPHEVIEQRGYEAAVPVIEAVAVTPSGDLWVKRRSPGTSVRSLDVFDNEGQYIQTVTPSPPFPIGFLPDGRFVTIETDSLEIQTLAVYAVEN
ncbi:MAG: 6-bladed beta-propeller [Dehalococcoidia bacterium]